MTSALAALLFVAAPSAWAREGDGARCEKEGRSLVETREIAFAGPRGWTMSAVRRMGAPSCRAEATFKSGDELTLITGASEKAKGWYLGITSRRRRLKDVEESPARLHFDGAPGGAGMLLAVSDSAGGKTVARYVRAEFRSFETDLEKAKGARKIELRADGFETLKVPSLKRVLESLKRCLGEAADDDFWKYAEKTCG